MIARRDRSLQRQHCVDVLIDRRRMGTQLREGQITEVPAGIEGVADGPADDGMKRKRGQIYF